MDRHTYNRLIKSANRMGSLVEKLESKCSKDSHKKETVESTSFHGVQEALGGDFALRNCRKCGSTLAFSLTGERL